MNPSATGFTGDANREIIYQLSVCWHRHKQGRAFDNNTGFFLPDGSMFAPDAAYNRREKSRRITQEEGGHVLRVVPDFVVELLSPSDTLAKTKRKMETWISNGVELGWLVDPYKNQVLVYEPGKPMSTESGDFVEGTGPPATAFAGCAYNGSRLWLWRRAQDVCFPVIVRSPCYSPAKRFSASGVLPAGDGPRPKTSRPPRN